MDIEPLQQPARLKITNVFEGPLRHGYATTRASRLSETQLWVGPALLISALCHWRPSLACIFVPAVRQSFELLDYAS